MRWKDNGNRFGGISITLHWTTAFFVLTLLVLGFTSYFLDRGPLRSSLLNVHVSLGLTFIPIYVVRVYWRLHSGKPVTEQSNALLQFLAETIWRLLLAVIVVQLLTGPLLVWLHGRPASFFGLFDIGPLVSRNEALHRALVRPIHLVSGVLLVLLIATHLAGALKHLLVDKDGVVERMFGSGTPGTP